MPIFIADGIVYSLVIFCINYDYSIVVIVYLLSMFLMHLSPVFRVDQNVANFLFIFLIANYLEILHVQFYGIYGKGHLVTFRLFSII